MGEFVHRVPSVFGFVATALELIDPMCFCNALSTGQLPFQIVHPVSIAMLFATGVAFLPSPLGRETLLQGWALPFGVMLASTLLSGLVGLNALSQ